MAAPTLGLLPQLPRELVLRIVSIGRQLWLMEQNALLVASSTRRAAAIYRTGSETAECLVRAADAQGTFLPRPVACVTLRLIQNVKGVPTLEAEDRRALVLLLRAVAGDQAWYGITDRTTVVQLFGNQRAADWRQLLRGGAGQLPDCMLSWREVEPEELEPYGTSGGFSPVVQVAELIMR